MAIQELVVPRSIPMTFDIFKSLCFRRFEQREPKIGTRAYVHAFVAGFDPVTGDLAYIGLGLGACKR